MFTSSTTRQVVLEERVPCEVHQAVQISLDRPCKNVRQEQSDAANERFAWSVRAVCRSCLGRSDKLMNRCRASSCCSKRNASNAVETNDARYDRGRYSMDTSQRATTHARPSSSWARNLNISTPPHHTTPSNPKLKP